MKIQIAKVTPSRGRDGEVIVSQYGHTKFDLEDSVGNKYTGWGAYFGESANKEIEAEVVEDPKYGKQLKKPKTDLPFRSTQTTTVGNIRPVSIPTEPLDTTFGRIVHGVTTAYVTSTGDLDPSEDVWKAIINLSKKIKEVKE